MRVANQTQYKCKHLAATSLPTHMPSVEVLSAHANLLRSDHVMFWYHNSTEYIDTLQAVLLTDTGNATFVAASIQHSAITLLYSM